MLTLQFFRMGKIVSAYLLAEYWYKLLYCCLIISVRTDVRFPISSIAELTHAWWIPPELLYCCYRQILKMTSLPKWQDKQKQCYFHSFCPWTIIHIRRCNPFDRTPLVRTDYRYCLYIWFSMRVSPYVSSKLGFHLEYLLRTAPFNCCRPVVVQSFYPSMNDPVRDHSRQTWCKVFSCNAFP